MAHTVKQDYVIINVFDDGNQKYEMYPNKWIMIEYMFGGGKVKLKNFHYPDIIIGSISTWKLLLKE